MKKTLVLLITFFYALHAQAQLFIDNNYTIEDMINGFFNNSPFMISNVTYTGTQASLAFFEGSQSNIGLNAGLLITNGKAENAIGPNNTGSLGTGMGVPGSIWLDALIPGFSTYDAAIVEMDVVPATDTLCFRYVFGSEEYKEYVGSQFNDVFAFLVEGPGLPVGDSIFVEPDTLIHFDSCITCIDTLIITQDTIIIFDSLQMTDTFYVFTDTITFWCYQDPACPPDTIIYPGYWYASPGGVNIALVPNTNLPVTINNLNQNDNNQFFVDNAGGLTVQYDAFTQPLWAKLLVTPGETYHVRIAIADAGDPVYDSGVFLSIESLGGDSLLAVEVDFVPQPSGQDEKTVGFQNQSLWATSWHWDFGDGSTSDEKHPEHTYDADGLYTVSLTASNWCSTETFTQQVQIGSVGTNEPSSSVFSIAPNPVNGSFVLQLKQHDRAQVRLSDLSGRLLLDQPVSNGARIDLSTFGKGIFVLQVIADGKVYSEKVIKSH